jgi:hypothetical protein
MSKFHLAAGVLLLSFSIGFSAEETVPPKIFVKDFSAVSASAAQAYLFEEESRSIISRISNAQLVLDFQATNYLDTSDITKFLLLNKINVCLIGELKQTQGKFELNINAVNRDGKSFSTRLDFSDLNEGITKLRKSLPLWLEDHFPRIPKNILVKEEVEKIGVGRFEYVNPAVITELGFFYSGNSIPIAEMYSNEIGLYLDSAFRYKWLGFNFGASASFLGIAEYAVYGGPEINAFNGLLTLTARIGYRTADTEDNILSFHCFYFSPVMMVNVTDRYQLALGGYFTPLSEINRIDYSLPPSVAENQNWPYEYSGKFNLTGGFLRFNIGITPVLWAGFQYNIWLILIPDSGGMPPLVVNSSLSGGISYKFTLGGK